jgi:hypothetical protein
MALSQRKTTMKPTWVLKLAASYQIGPSNDFKRRTLEIEFIGSREEAIKMQDAFQQLMSRTNTGSPVVELIGEQS